MVNVVIIQLLRLPCHPCYGVSDQAAHRGELSLGILPDVDQFVDEFAMYLYNLTCIIRFVVELALDVVVNNQVGSNSCYDVIP